MTEKSSLLKRPVTIGKFTLSLGVIIILALCLLCSCCLLSTFTLDTLGLLPTNTATLTTAPTATQTQSPTQTQILIQSQLPTQTQTPTISNNQAPCNCTGPNLNCCDFNSHSQAQTCFNYCKSLGYGDIFGLDHDNDGSVCESLP